MQEAQERLEPTTATSRGYLTAPRAAAVVLLILSLAFALWLTQKSSADSPATTADPINKTDVPTEAEAIAIFVDLDRSRLALYRELDDTLLSTTFTPNGPLRKRVAAEIGQLRDDEVSVRPVIRTRDLKLVRATPSTITLRQLADVSMTFVNRHGQDVSRGGAETQTIIWDLQKQSGEWFLHDAVITRVQAITGE